MKFNYNILWVANVSIIGCVGDDVLAVSLSEEGKDLFLNIFYAQELSEEQIEEFQASTTELWTKVDDIWDDVKLNLHKVESPTLLPRIGVTLFRKLGTRYKS